MHHRVSTYVPKCTTYARNFNGLCHSAVHSQTFGTGKSCILIAKMLKIKNSRKNPMHHHMSKRDQKSVYDSRRQTTFQFKRNRYLNKKKRINRKLQKDSALNNPEVSEHHNYAINPYQWMKKLSLLYYVDWDSCTLLSVSKANKHSFSFIIDLLWWWMNEFQYIIILNNKN